MKYVVWSIQWNLGKKLRINDFVNLIKDMVSIETPKGRKIIEEYQDYFTIQNKRVVAVQNDQKWLSDLADNGQGWLIGMIESGEIDVKPLMK